MAAKKHIEYYVCIKRGLLYNNDPYEDPKLSALENSWYQDQGPNI
jgi:hypothetical protein